MRVLFVCPNLQAGGAERHWSILLPGLAARGYSVSVLTVDGRGSFFDSLQASGIPAWTTAEAGRRRNVAALHRMLRLPADVIVSRATSADGLGLMTKRLRPRVRWAVNWHHPAGMPIADRRRMILRHVLPRADAVFAVSGSQIDDLETLGVRREAIHVVPNGTDIHPLSDARARTRVELGLADHEVAFLLVGRLQRQKRIDRFVEAIGRAQQARPEIVGLVAGAGPDRQRLEQHAADSHARVHFLGRRDDIPKVLSASDGLCLVSDHEALPFVVLEAMAMALPVIATRVGGLTEVVVPDETGLLVDRDDTDGLIGAIIRVARDSDLRSSMGAAGRRRQTQLYSAEPMADAYASLLRSLG